MDLSLRRRVLCSVFIVPADDLAFVNIVIRSHNRSGIQCLNMASSNPRKFSEKIALHTQKQAEETADFEKIMNEVRSAKPNQINGDCSPSHLVISPISPFRAGSLPNVNSPSTNSTSIDLQSALNNLGDMRAGRESGYRDRRSAGPGGGGYSPGSSLGSVRPTRRSDQTTSSNPHSYQMHPSGGLVQAPQISGSVGSPSLSHSTGAGSSGNGGLSTNVAYLSPPLDPCWRRHSDSALHQAAMVSGEGVTGNASTTLSRRGQDGNNYINSMDPNSSSVHLGISATGDGRPKSCCDVSRVPGINICPGPEPNGIQIPIGSNTGSLPDLTNLQFASPLSDPIDGDDNSFQTHPLYSTQSPNVVSPSYGANGLNDHSHPLNSLNMGLNPGPPGGSSRGSSPGPSPSQRRRPHHQLVNLQLRSPSHAHSSQNHSHNHSSGIALDPNGISVPSYQPYLYQNSGGGADYGQPVSPAHSPTHMMSPSQPIPTHGGLLTAYRNPQPILRPSPISSPTLVVPGHMNYRSNSPGDGTNCASSAPPSPVSQSLSPASSPGLAASPASPFADQISSMNCQNQMGSGSGGNLNQMSFYPNQSNVLNQFEQFNMMDSSSEQTLQSYGNYKSNHMGQANISMDISLDPFYSQPSQFMFGGRLELNQQTAPQTPQTPSSIPDIVLQDFSCTPEELARHNSHDLSSAMGSSFDGVDFYPTDDALRDGLDPIDFDGLQILTNSTLVTDPSTEDHFRLDRM
ncbi:CREB-regulated transcription coactivator 1 isoform X3 [Daphnia magna]|uniref:CREB-regulated transcription coactivator 1 isoform X3 n=1 Tax=Daphnia magna TaxID=35525 RepID=UPI001E1BBDF9|nr:CREB-regulated transcription coactivator 1 isoform X3 [Daphnia magna]